jgi:hypothetical protein
MEGVSPMNGFIRRAALGTSLGILLTVTVGCVQSYRELVDPCWPERYRHQARESIRDAFNVQAANGHALDQTVWNQHFEAGTDKLTRAGEEHLKYMARRQPAPDPNVTVQPAYDAKGNAKNLDERRVQAVQEYLSKIAANRGAMVNFVVTVRDMSEPGLPTRTAPNIYYTPAAVREAQQLLRDTTPGAATGSTTGNGTQPSTTGAATGYTPATQGPNQR